MNKPQELGSWKGIGEQWQYCSRVHLKRFNKIRHIFDKKRKKKRSKIRHIDALKTLVNMTGHVKKKVK